MSGDREPTQVKFLLADCRLVPGEDVGRDPAALFDLKPLRFGPGAYLGVADAALGSLCPFWRADSDRAGTCSRPGRRAWAVAGPVRAAITDWGSPVEPIDRALKIAGPSRIPEHPNLPVLWR